MGIGRLHNPQAGLWPFAASLFLIILCLTLLITGFLNRRASDNLSDLWLHLHWRKNIAVIAALLLYSLAVSTMGYIIATFVLMAVLFSIWGMRNWMVIGNSLLAAFLSYGLFQHLLKTPLPRSIWGF